MATLVRRATVKRDLAKAVGLEKPQDGGHATISAYLISEDNKAAVAELGMVIRRIPGGGLMRARDYWQALVELQGARVVFRRAGKKGDATLNTEATAWADRVQRVAAFPLKSLLARVGELTPAAAFITAETHDRIVGIVAELWRYGTNGGMDVH